MYKIKEIDSLTFRDNNVQRNPAIWLDKSILVYNLWTRIFPEIWGLHVKIGNYNVFHFRLLPAKSIDKFLMKSIKTPISAHFEPFSPILGENNFSQKSAFLFIDFYAV